MAVPCMMKLLAERQAVCKQLQQLVDTAMQTACGIRHSLNTLWDVDERNGQKRQLLRRSAACAGGSESHISRRCLRRASCEVMR